VRRLEAHDLKEDWGTRFDSGGPGAILRRRRGCSLGTSNLLEDSPGVARAGVRACLALQPGAGGVVGANARPRIAVSAQHIGQHPCAHLDAGAGLQEIGFGDAEAREPWQKACIDLHQPNVPRVGAMEVRVVDRTWTHSRLDARNASQQVSIETESGRVTVKALIEVSSNCWRASRRNRWECAGGKCTQEDLDRARQRGRHD
jgi:hypothetical protein